MRCCEDTAHQARKLNPFLEYIDMKPSVKAVNFIPDYSVVVCSTISNFYENIFLFVRGTELCNTLIILVNDKRNVRPRRGHAGIKEE
jgi:hypothetical protein